MNNFIFLSLAISIVLGTPDSDLPLFDDYESYDNLIVTPLIGGESEFPAIDSVSFFFLFSICMYFTNFYTFLPSVSLDGLLW